MKIGVFGAGQLASMLAQAGKPMGMELICLSPEASPCAQQYATVVVAPYEDIEACDRLAEAADVLTYEHEMLPLEQLEKYQQAGLLKPSLKALSITQDRLFEKRYLNSQAINTAAFANIEETEHLAEAGEVTGFPAIMKTRTGGYDGKGQARVESADELAAAWKSLGELPCILERMVTFNRELSIIGVRNPDNQMVFYPVAENQHSDGILRVSEAKLSDPLQQQAESMMERLLVDLDYVGVMTLELFDDNGTLVANEIAPRVHNSGHWTIEGANASQFKNHLLAITGQPLINPRPAKLSAMVNVIGEVPDLQNIENMPNTAVHMYGKDARPGRKLGHITLTQDPATPADDAKPLLTRLNQVLATMHAG